MKGRTISVVAGMLLLCGAQITAQLPTAASRT